MKIKKILISQPAPLTEKSPYHDLAKSTNVKIDFRPFIEVQPISVKEFRLTKVNIPEHTAVLFTAKTAVDHFFRICKEIKFTVPESMKYFCISEAVAFYLQKYIVYRKRKIFYGNNTFDDLLSVINKHKNEKFLLPLSDVHKPEIPKKLKQAQIQHSKAILYRTVPCDLNDIQREEYDIFVFFSPSGIKSLLQNFPDIKDSGLKIGAFGSTTAKAVKDAGLKLDIQAPMPQAPSMTMALENYIRKVNKIAKK